MNWKKGGIQFRSIGLDDHNNIYSFGHYVCHSLGLRSILLIKWSYF